MSCIEEVSMNAAAQGELVQMALDHMGANRRCPAGQAGAPGLIAAAPHDIWSISQCLSFH